jgi:hypothetical protein
MKSSPTTTISYSNNAWDRLCYDCSREVEKTCLRPICGLAPSNPWSLSPDGRTLLALSYIKILRNQSKVFFSRTWLGTYFIKGKRVTWHNCKRAPIAQITNHQANNIQPRTEQSNRRKGDSNNPKQRKTYQTPIRIRACLIHISKL